MLGGGPDKGRDEPAVRRDSQTEAFEAPLRPGCLNSGYREPFAAQEPAAQFKCGGEEAGTDAPLLTGTTGEFGFAAGIDAPLFTGITGEFCFAAPPTTICFFAPPTELWAEAGRQKSFPNAAKIKTIATAPCFMNARPFMPVADRKLAQYTWTLIQSTWIQHIWVRRRGADSHAEYLGGRALPATARRRAHRIPSPGRFARVGCFAHVSRRDL